MKYRHYNTDTTGNAQATKPTTDANTCGNTDTWEPKQGGRCGEDVKVDGGLNEIEMRSSGTLLRTGFTY